MLPSSPLPANSPGRAITFYRDDTERDPGADIFDAAHAHQRDPRATSAVAPAPASLLLVGAGRTRTAPAARAVRPPTPATAPRAASRVARAPSSPIP